MKKILIRIGVLICLVLVLNLALNKLIYSELAPFYWGSSIIKNKYEVLKKNDYNVLFIGSSKTRVQIKTQLFDSLLNQGESGRYRSFNFGINSLLPPESFYVYSNLLKDGVLKDYQYVIFELGHVANPNYGNLHKKRPVYSLNFDNYAIALRAVWESNRSFFVKIFSSMGYSVNYIDRLINLGIVDELSRFHSNTMQEQEEETESIDEIIRNQGFTMRKDTVFAEHAFLQLSNRLDQLKSISSRQFNDLENSAGKVKNQTLLNLANEYIALSEEQGIHLIFAFTRQWNEYQYRDLIPVFQNIHPNHKIVFSDSRELPALFTAEFSNDFSHLNSKGSGILTTYIANQFTQIVDAKKEGKVNQQRLVRSETSDNK